MSRVDKYGNPMPPSKSDFFAMVRERFNEAETDIIGRAYEIAKAGHYKYEREDGNRYFDHPKMIAWILMKEFGIQDHEIIVEALLYRFRQEENDFILTPDFIRLNFGENVVSTLHLLTRQPGEEEDVVTYLQRLQTGGFRPIIIKLVGRLTNLRTLNSRTPEKRHKTVEETLQYYFPLATFLLGLRPLHDRDTFRLDNLVAHLMMQECQKYN